MANIKDRLAVQRVDNKPYTISEYNHPYPNQFGAEGQPMLCAYGRLHGWDGVFQYSYNHYVDQFEPQANPWCFFDCIARTDVLAHFPACAAIFLRGDVPGRSLDRAAVDLAAYRAAGGAVGLLQHRHARHGHAAVAGAQDRTGWPAADQIADAEAACRPEGVHQRHGEIL